MTSASPARDTRRGGQIMSIGEVLSRLRPEFPDITISKLRFLEAEGLVEPLRAPSGYRKYTEAHLERLRFILTAQRDRYLPLRVIREHVEAMDRGEPVIGLADNRVPEPTRPQPGDSRLSRSQLAERSGLDEDGLADLERYGLLVAAPNGDYGGDALMVARVAAQLRGYGIEARHLRPYRTTADREVGLLAQLVPTIARQAGPGGRMQALETVHELAALCAQLHGALVRQGLRQALGG
jgi:DNA-binding transcriptional MerR regulator